MIVIDKICVCDSAGRLREMASVNVDQITRANELGVVITVRDTMSGEKETLWSQSVKDFWIKLREMQPYGYSYSQGANSCSGSIVLTSISEEAVAFLDYVDIVKSTSLHSDSEFFREKKASTDWLNEHRVTSYDKLHTLFMRCGFSAQKGRIYTLLDVCLHMQDCWFGDSIYLMRGREKAYNGFKYRCYCVDFEDVAKARIFLTKMAVLRG